MLFVADIDNVRKFDEAGAPLGAIAVPNATFLNDVVASADGKTIYVTDSAIGPDFKPKGTAAIFAIVGDEAPKALEIAALGNTNGIDVESTPAGDVLYFNGFDDGKVVHRFDLATKTASTIAVPAGQLDGLAVVKDGDANWYIVTSWAARPGRRTPGWPAPRCRRRSAWPGRETRRWPEAIACLEAALTADKGDCAMKALEQYANFRVRYAAELWQKGDPTEAAGKREKTRQEQIERIDRPSSTSTPCAAAPPVPNA